MGGALAVCVSVCAVLECDIPPTLLGARKDIFTPLILQQPAGFASRFRHGPERVDERRGRGARVAGATAGATATATAGATATATAAAAAAAAAAAGAGAWCSDWSHNR